MISHICIVGTEFITFLKEDYLKEQEFYHLKYTENGKLIYENKNLNTKIDELEKENKKYNLLLACLEHTNTKYWEEANESVKLKQTIRILKGDK